MLAADHPVNRALIAASGGARVLRAAMLRHSSVASIQEMASIVLGWLPVAAGMTLVKGWVFPCVPFITRIVLPRLAVGCSCML